MRKGQKMSEENKKKLSEKLRQQFQEGRKNWNKGLTKETDERVRKNSEKTQKTIAERGSFKLEKNPRWKGGIRAYKNLALNHYGRKCQICGKEDERPKMIHVHHKDENRLNNELENLEVLCSSCHRKKHPQEVSEYQKKRASETHKGIPKSLEQRKKMSEARKNWWKQNRGYKI